jgi:DNA-binding transcriptional LysR family regulator
MTDTSSKRYPEWEPLMTWIALVQAGSVSEAGRRLGISQAAVSQRVKALETIFGTALLDRASRPAKATAAGERLFEHATALARNAEQMMEGVRGISRSKRRVVRMGCTDSFAAAGGPVIIRALSASAQQIRLWSGSTDHIEQSLEQRQLDTAITPVEKTAVPGIKRVPLFSEPFVVVLPTSFPVQRSGSLQEMARHLPLIRYSARAHNGKCVDDYLSANGDMIERTCEFDTTEPVLSMVSTGLGFALTTPLCIWQARHHIPQLRVLPVAHFVRRRAPYPQLSRTFYLSYRESELGTLADELRTLIVQSFSRQIGPDIAAALALPLVETLVPADERMSHAAPFSSMPGT